MNALITTLLLSNFGGITYETIDFLRAINIDYGYEIYLMHHSSTQVVLWFVNACTMRISITLDRIIPAPGRGSPTHIDCKNNEDGIITNKYKYEVVTSSPKRPQVSLDISKPIGELGTKAETLDGLETLVSNSPMGFDNICSSDDRDWIIQYISTRFY